MWSEKGPRRTKVCTADVSWKPPQKTKDRWGEEVKEVGARPPESRHSSPPLRLYLDAVILLLVNLSREPLSSWISTTPLPPSPTTTTVMKHIYHVAKRQTPPDDTACFAGDNCQNATSQPPAPRSPNTHQLQPSSPTCSPPQVTSSCLVSPTAATSLTAQSFFCASLQPGISLILSFCQSVRLSPCLGWFKILSLPVWIKTWRRLTVLLPVWTH